MSPQDDFLCWTTAVLFAPYAPAAVTDSNVDDTVDQPSHSDAVHSTEQDFSLAGFGPDDDKQEPTTLQHTAPSFTPPPPASLAIQRIEVSEITRRVCLAVTSLRGSTLATDRPLAEMFGHRSRPHHNGSSPHTQLHLRRSDYPHPPI